MAVGVVEVVPDVGVILVVARLLHSGCAGLQGKMVVGVVGVREEVYMVARLSHLVLCRLAGEYSGFKAEAWVEGDG